MQDAKKQDGKERTIHFLRVLDTSVRKPTHESRNESRPLAACKTLDINVGVIRVKISQHKNNAKQNDERVLSLLS